MIQFTAATMLGPDHFYSRDVISIHGTPEDLRDFAQRLLDVACIVSPQPAVL